MKRKKLLKRLSEGHLRNVAFGDIITMVEGFGFRLVRTSGSHHIFAHPDVAELVNLQDVKGEAKSFGGRGMSDYHINIFYSEEDGGYIADIPDLDFCSAFGETPEQALEQVEKAKKAWIEAAHQAGKPVPAPRYRPVIYQASH